MLKIYQACIRPLMETSFFEEQMQLVHPQRRAKVLRCKRKEDQCRALAAGLLLREGILREGISYEKAVFCETKDGKPMLAGGAQIYFNLSHSGEYALAAFSHQEVGVDVEDFKARLLGDRGRAHMDFIIRRSFTKQEQERIRTLAEEEQRIEVIRIWTRKESYAKVIGSGLKMDFSRIDTDHGAFFHSRKIGEDCWFSVCTLEEEAELLLIPVDFLDKKGDDKAKADMIHGGALCTTS